jgi:hypothetical protein
MKTLSNQAAAGNGAIVSCFQFASLRRAMPELQRSPKPRREPQMIRKTNRKPFCSLPRTGIDAGSPCSPCPPRSRSFSFYHGVPRAAAPQPMRKIFSDSVTNIHRSTTEITEITEKPQALQLDGALKTGHPAWHRTLCSKPILSVYFRVFRGCLRQTRQPETAYLL